MTTWSAENDDGKYSNDDGKCVDEGWGKLFHTILVALIHI